MQVKSYAKINWALRIVGRRADGYHDIETLFQTISLSDTITLMESDAWRILCDDPAVPCDESNLVMKAARVMDPPPMYLALQKRIPVGGGLGGGSSNAAATLRAVDEMFAMGTPPQRLSELGLMIGSDVPFFLNGGIAYGTGRGENLTPLRASKPISLLLVIPGQRMSTAEAYSMIKTYSKPLGVDRYRDIQDNLLAHPDLLVNDFEDPVFRRIPALREYRERLLRLGAVWAGMTGSGTTVVGAFKDRATRDAARPSFYDVRTESAETLTSGA